MWTIFDPTFFQGGLDLDLSVRRPQKLTCSGLRRSKHRTYFCVKEFRVGISDQRDRPFRPIVTGHAGIVTARFGRTCPDISDQRGRCRRLEETGCDDGDQTGHAEVMESHDSVMVLRIDQTERVPPNFSECRSDQCPQYG